MMVSRGSTSHQLLRRVDDVVRRLRRASGCAGGSLMTRLVLLLAGACVVTLYSFGTAGDDQPTAKKKGAALVADRIWWGAEFELTLTAPDTGGKFQRTRDGVVW